ncbi:MAG: nuclear transport factor 2 family protein [Bacteroidales bacterium]|nr:nuclear transport factor 2 family protein [Bacteroidales bacterium]
MDTESIVLTFNKCINNADIEGLSNLMSENHVFIDRDNNRTEGKSNNISQTWKPFFRLFPDYKNIFEKVTLKGDRVILEGYSVCSEEILNNVHAIWIAQVTEGKISLWHIYDDTPENREILGIKEK